MLNSLTEMLSECKLEWKPDSPQVMCSMSTLLDSFSLWVQNEELVVEAVSSMEVLGVCIDTCGSTHASVDHRMLKAHRAFWAEKSLYCNKFVSIYTRFKRYVTRLMPRLLRGSSSWAWSQSLCQKLTTWGNRCLRNMLGAKGKEGETWVPWVRRTTRAARRLLSAWVSSFPL